MRQLIAIALCALLAIGANAQNNKTKQQNMKTIVTYFSCTQTTKHAAAKLAKDLNADLFEIVPEKAYTSADLN